METASSKAMCDILKKIHLQGTIGECLLVVKKGDGKVLATDMSNTVFAVSSESLAPSGDAELGLPNLATLTRFLDGATDDVSLAIKEQWLTISKKKHGSLKFLMLESKQVPTAIMDEDADKKILKAKGTLIPFSKGVREDFAFYMGLVASKAVVFRVKDGKAYLQSASSEPEQFKLTLGATEAGDFQVSVYGDLLLKVLTTVDGLGLTESLQIYIGDNAPLFAYIDDDNFWALSPIQ